MSLFSPGYPLQWFTLPRTLLALAIAAISATGCKPAWNAAGSASTYDDCILAKVQGSMSEPAVLAIKNACAQKFPPAFDFDTLARQQLLPVWAELRSRPAYAALTEEEKALAKDEYFLRIAPAIHPDFKAQAKDQYEVFLRSVPAPDAANGKPPSNVGQQAGLKSVQLDIGEKFGAALAATESIRVLAEETECSYIFKRRQPSYQEQARKILEQVPTSERGYLSAFADKRSAPARGLRKASSDAVTESLQNARVNMKLDVQTSCGFAAGILSTAAKSASENWQRALNGTM